MKTTIILAAITGLIISAQAQGFFSATAVRSGSPIHFKQLVGAGQHLYLGGNTADYCPSDIQSMHLCPNTTHTNFAGGIGALAMGAEVPGGQWIYIDPTCGAVKYQQAHSIFMPNGSYLGGWNLTEGANFGTLDWVGAGPLAGFEGLLACNGTTDGSWEVFADIGITPPGTCITFDVVTINETKAAAWQYM